MGCAVNGGGARALHFNKCVCVCVCLTARRSWVHTPTHTHTLGLPSETNEFLFGRDEPTHRPTHRPAGRPVDEAPPAF